MSCHSEGAARRICFSLVSWPSGIYADFMRLAGLMEQHGADLRLPHSRAMGDGLFELRCKGSEGIGRALYRVKEVKREN